MAGTNAFLNGFLGGMQTVNSMIDSQARREYYKTQQQREEKKWQWQQQQQAQQQETYEQKKQLQNTQAWAYRVSQMDPDQKKKFYQDVAPELIRQEFGNAFDNKNDGETAEFSHFKVQGDQLIPIMSVKDKDGKMIRSGPATKGRTNEKGDPIMGISMDNMFNALATDPSLRNLSARANAETLRLGGKLPKQGKAGGAGRGKIYKEWEEDSPDGKTVKFMINQLPDGRLVQSRHMGAGKWKFERDVTGDFYGQGMAGNPQAPAADQEATILASLQPGGAETKPTTRDKPAVKDPGIVENPATVQANPATVQANPAVAKKRR